VRLLPCSASSGAAARSTARCPRSLLPNAFVAGGAELFARVINVANRRYPELISYDAFQKDQFTPGVPRSVFAGVRYAW
jgi:outer membrane receptor protein involved in Fe transport